MTKFYVRSQIFYPLIIKKCLVDTVDVLINTGSYFGRLAILVQSTGTKFSEIFHTLNAEMTIVFQQFGFSTVAYSINPCQLRCHNFYFITVYGLLYIHGCCSRNNLRIQSLIGHEYQRM